MHLLITLMFRLSMYFTVFILAYMHEYSYFQVLLYGYVLVHISILNVYCTRIYSIRTIHTYSYTVYYVSYIRVCSMYAGTSICSLYCTSNLCTVRVICSLLKIQQTVGTESAAPSAAFVIKQEMH